MARGEVVIDEDACRGCVLCVHFCNRGCLIARDDHISPRGYLLPTFVQAERCTACGVCVWMCPHSAIEVFRLIGAEEEEAASEAADSAQTEPIASAPK